MILSITMYDSEAGGGPICTASSAIRTCSALTIGIRMDRDRGDAHLARGLDHAAGDLAPVGDQDLLEHVRLSLRLGRAHCGAVGRSCNEKDHRGDVAPVVPEDVAGGRAAARTVYLVISRG
jgi:hypothetical protein